MNRVGAIDCGTNSIRLLIADKVDGRLRDVHREMRIVRLGQGVDATGQFAPDAIARTKGALVDYAELLRNFEVSKVRMVATSAARDAANRDMFFTMTADVLGAVVPGAVAEVITGTEEAGLSFHGAIDELNPTSAPFVVVDLGGGSTEVVVGDRDVQASFSADIGCVRLTERFLHSDPRAARGGTAGGARRAGPHVGGRGRHDDHAVGSRAADDDLRLGRDPPVPGWVR
jgi:exopolyphosphatase / guanosine-5'-triphosphate,3'-diphosphate pyrophosphatase